MPEDPKRIRDVQWAVLIRIAGTQQATDSTGTVLVDRQGILGCGQARVIKVLMLGAERGENSYWNEGLRLGSYLYRRTMMLVTKELMVVATIVGILLGTADSSKAALPEVAEEESEAYGTKAEPAEVKEAGVPPKLIFCDGFEYEVTRDHRNERPAFITEGKWSGVKSENSNGKGLGYLYTVDRIPGYTGPLPGRNSKRVLAIEGRSKTFSNQTDFYLQYGSAQGPADQIPGNVWFQFWLYVNHHDDPKDQEDQLSGFADGFKFIYPSVDGRYPTHPAWLFTLGRSSHVFLKEHDKPFFAETASQDLLLSLPTESGAEITKAEPWNRWKLGQTSLEERIVANRWTLVKLHMDSSSTSGRYEAWLAPLGGRPVKVVEWIDGVTKDFSWRIPAEKVGGYRAFRMPTTIGGWGERAKDNKDCWIYMDDFAMASSEEALPEYCE